MVIFAGLTGDYHPAHIDEEYSKSRSPFGRRVAHGFLTLSVCNGLLVRSGVIDPEAKEFLVGVNNVQFLKPVFIGDTIRVEYTVSERRPSRSLEGMDIVTLRGVCKNQRGEDIMTYDHIIAIEQRERRD